jgi:hypothetical protein
MLSPIKENEFVVMGAGEWKRQKRDLFRDGLMAGMVLAFFLFVAILEVGELWKSRHPGPASSIPGSWRPDTLTPANARPPASECAGYAMPGHPARRSCA